MLTSWFGIGRLARALQALLFRFPQGNEPTRHVQFPGVFVASTRIPPGGERLEECLAPGRRVVILDGRIAAVQHSCEVLYALAHLRCEPRRILVADPRHPLRLCPFLWR